MKTAAMQKQKRNTPFSELLDAYEAVAQGQKQRQEESTWKDQLSGWRAYATATGAGLALATAVGADIIYSGPQNITASVPGAIGTATAPINIDGAIFNLYVRRKNQFTGEALADLQAGANSVLVNGSNQLRRLASGAVISAGAGSFAGGNRLLRSTAFFGAHIGTWPKSATGLAGFKFKGTDGQQHYGWIRLEWQDLHHGNGAPDTITAIDWAYESTPNAPVQGGEGASATPEPSTLTLALLALGSGGVLTWRRRRQQRAATAGVT